MKDPRTAANFTDLIALFRRLDEKIEYVSKDFGAQDRRMIEEFEELKSYQERLKVIVHKLGNHLEIFANTNEDLIVLKSLHEWFTKKEENLEARLDQLIVLKARLDHLSSLSLPDGKGKQKAEGPSKSSSQVSRTKNTGRNLETIQLPGGFGAGSARGWIEALGHSDPAAGAKELILLEAAELMRDRRRGSSDCVDLLKLKNSTCCDSMASRPKRAMLLHRGDGSAQSRAVGGVSNQTNEVLGYIQAVEEVVGDNSEMYLTFFNIVSDSMAERINPAGVVAVVAARIEELFEAHPNLLLEFNKFLPEDFEFVLLDYGEDQYMENIKFTLSISGPSESSSQVSRTKNTGRNLETIELPGGFGAGSARVWIEKLGHSDPASGAKELILLEAAELMRDRRRGSSDCEDLLKLKNSTGCDSMASRPKRAMLLDGSAQSRAVGGGSNQTPTINEFRQRRKINWMEKGRLISSRVYDALQNKYMKTLLVCECEAREKSSVPPRYSRSEVQPDDEWWRSKTVNDLMLNAIFTATWELGFKLYLRRVARTDLQRMVSSAFRSRVGLGNNLPNFLAKRPSQKPPCDFGSTTLGASLQAAELRRRRQEGAFASFGWLLRPAKGPGKL